jgi:putative membrane protein
MGTGGMGMGMGSMWIFGLLLMIGLVVLVVVAVRAMAGGISRGDRGPTTPGRSRAREVLDERYARGELSSEEYRERLQGLGEDT